MKEHTPAPWTIAPGHDGVIATVKIGDRDRFTVYLGSSGAPAEEWNANARLIAAAPELLAELRELAALSDASIDEGDPALLGSFRDAARRLVAKAEGH